jgi:hypothetical protein
MLQNGGRGGGKGEKQTRVSNEHVSSEQSEGTCDHNTSWFTRWPKCHRSANRRSPHTPRTPLTSSAAHAQPRVLGDWKPHRVRRLELIHGARVCDFIVDGRVVNAGLQQHFNGGGYARSLGAATLTTARGGRCDVVDDVVTRGFVQSSQFSQAVLHQRLVAHACCCCNSGAVLESVCRQV